MPRIFEQGDDVQPIGSYRVASGKIGTPTINHSWDTIKAWLQTVLTFLKPNSNLSDVTNVPIARNNLGVLSSGDTMNAISNAITNAPNNSRLELVFSIKVNGRIIIPEIADRYLAPKYSGTTIDVIKVAGTSGRYTVAHYLDIDPIRQMCVVECSMAGSTVKTSGVARNNNYIDVTFGDDVSPNDTDFYMQFFKII